MSEPWIVILLVFGAVALGADALYSLLAHSWRTRQSTARRLAFSQQLSGRTTALDALREERAYFDSQHPLIQRLNDRLAQTGLRLQGPKIVLYVGALFTVMFLAWSAVLGAGALSACGALSSTLGLSVLWLEMRRQKRMAAFSEQLPDALDVIVRGVRVGYPLPIAINLAARELAEPLASEFQTTFDEIAFGQDIRTAVENLYRRVGHEDLQFFVVAVIVQNQTGGNLAEVLSRLSRLLRTRLKLRLRIRSLSAEGRISAVVLSLMPFILFGGISLISPSYFGEVRNDPLIVPALIYSGLSLLVGNFVMYRMVHFKF